MIVIIQGGGDLGSGGVLRLYRAGFSIIITELAQPLAVRRLVSFSEAVYAGETIVEEVKGVLVKNIHHALQIIEGGEIPIIVDPEGKICTEIVPDVIIDARMKKTENHRDLMHSPLIIGLGPGFIAGDNCHAFVETNRGHFLGRVYWTGTPEVDTGIPGLVGQVGAERVLRSPNKGIFLTQCKIGDIVEEGQGIAEIGGMMVKTPFYGMMRGLLRSGVFVNKNIKIGDVDPRIDYRLCTMVSEKSLAVAGGVVEAILTNYHFTGFSRQ